MAAIDGSIRSGLHANNINAALLTELLSRKYSGVEVESVIVGPPIVGMGVKHLLRVEFRRNPEALLPSTMIAKGRFGRHSSAWDWMFDAEMRSYRDFLPTVNIPAPDVYFAGHDPSTGSSLLLMENLSDRGVKFNDVHSSLTYRQAAAFLDVLARCHSSYWNSPALHEGGQFAWTLPLVSGWLLDSYFRNATSSCCWERYLAMPRGATVPRKLRNGESMFRGVCRLTEFHKATPWCITHGDCHFGNSYLDSDSNPGFIDWQIKRGPWQQDVTYFLVSALDVTDRREWERPLLEYYFGRLSHYGVETPTFSQAFLAYRMEVIYGLLIWITNGDDHNEFQSEAINTGNTHRFATAALDHGSLELLS